MIEFDQDELNVSVQNVKNLARAIDDWSQNDGPAFGARSLKQTVQQVIKKRITGSILQRAREYAVPHVGRRRALDIHADATIEATDVDGVISSYETVSAELYTNNIVVASHEGGSGSYGTRGPYKITPNDADHLVFENDEGFTVITDLVIHPGVRGKNFMYRAIRDEIDDIAREARDEAQQSLTQAIDNATE